MATSSVILDIRANTQRALSEFKAFSSQLDNKFLVSGLKLDVVRNALSQINREFQRSMGEQGLVSSQSLKAAENQAALLTNIYTGFSKTASSRIVEDFSEALSQVAVKTGGTVTDIQKTLATSPFLSRQFGRGEREAILGDIQRLQTFASQAGLGNNTADIFRKIATGDTNAIELTSADDALSKVIGEQLNRAGAPTELRTLSIEDRTRLIQQVIENLDVNELERLAKETGGFRVVLAKFSASLFNPKVGLFGAMREFNLAGVEGKTTIFKETTKLFESIFGEEGFIKTLGRELAKAFGVRDSTAVVRFLGRGINFITGLINGLKDLIDDVINNPITKGIINIAKQAFDGIKNLFVKLDELAKNPPKVPDISKESIQDFIREVGDNVRGFLRKVGAFIRGEDISDEAQSGASIIGTITDEAGKTILTFFKEVGGALLNKAGTIAIELGKQVIPTMVGLFTKALSGEGGLIGQIIAGIVGIKGVGLLASGARNLGGGIRNLRQGVSNFRDPNSGGVRGLFNRALGRPFGSLNPSIEDLEGGVNGFQAQLLNLVRSIKDCVCGGGFGGGGGRDIDIDANTPEARRERVRTRRGPTGPGMPKRAPLTSLDTINPYAYEGWDVKPTLIGDDAKYAYSRANKEARRNAIKGLTSTDALERYSESMRWSGGYRGVPLDDKERFEFARDNLESNYDFEKENKVRERYNRRFGKRARFSGAIKKFGKGALIAGGIAGGIALLSGGNAQASEIDPMTGEPIQQRVGTGEAFGKVGMGAAEGALTGMAFGPWGAAIGAVIGGGIALMDKGVRDAIGKSIKGFSEGVVKFGKDFIDGTKSAISGVFSNIGDLVRGIDWKGMLIRALIPGGDFTIKGLQGIAEFASKLNVFDAIKTGLDTIASPVRDLWNKISSWKPPWGNFAGLNYYGPAMAKEVQMSGGSPLLVNDREFVIPRDGFPILADNVGRYLDGKTRGSSGDITMSPVFNITINATGLAGDDIAAAIQPAVIKILDDGMKKASSDMITRGATTV